MNPHIKQLVIAAFLFVLSLSIGFIGYSVIEGLDAINAFYMTVITFSTVGFKEVTQLSPTGRLFTSVYIIMNMAFLAYILSVITSYLFEGKLRDVLKKYRSNMKLNKIKNHVIVCGYGRNGARACEELEKDGTPFIIIDMDEDMADTFPKHMNWYIGDATRDENLNAVGIERATAIIVTSPNDSVNVFITLTARSLNPGIKIITRTSSFQTQDKLYKAGADSVIMPDVLGGMYMAHIITKPTVIEFLSLINGTSSQDYHLEEVAYEDLKEEYQDKNLEDMNIIRQTGAVVIGVKDDIKGMIPAPSGQTLIGEGDHLILLGSTDCLKSFRKIFRK